MIALLLAISNPLHPIEDLMRNALEWIHSTLGLPWAWAIIVLTLMVRIVIVPLTVKQIRSMQHLQAHAPELKALQQKYKHDKQRMNEEVMKFYRENKINPAASCLPILIQIPVFISLYYVLRNFEKTLLVNYPGSDVGWLGIVPDITDNITDHWSGWVLLVIYVASQISSTYFMSTTMDPRQRWIFMALPLVFVLFIVNASFPVGLLLYWVTTNLWTVGQGLITRRLMPKPQTPAKRSSRTPPKDGGGNGDGATPKSPAPRPGAPAQQRVRRRKKKGPRSRR
ncbi:MAG TPA: YidC/Oxa1 family membrane protein insertase [Gaiellaceae bacterium]|nr:YidC/Oxa1 family membrane protein insertase [Gaiellaceae bacterium]